MAIKLTHREQMIIGVSMIILAGFLGWTGLGCYTGVETSIKTFQKILTEYSSLQMTKKAVDEAGKILTAEIVKYSIARPKPPGIIISAINPNNKGETKEMLIRKIMDEVMTIAKRHSLELVYYVPEDIDLAPPPPAAPSPESPAPVAAPSPIPQGKPLVSTQPPGIVPSAEVPQAPPPPLISDYIDQVPYKVELRGDYKDINNFLQELNNGLKVSQGTVTLGKRVFGIRTINMDINSNVDVADQRSKKALKLTLFLNIVLCKNSQC